MRSPIGRRCLKLTVFAMQSAIALMFSIMEVWQMAIIGSSGEPLNNTANGNSDGSRI